MFLSLNSQQQHALDAATQAFGPMLEGLVKYSIPITIVTFILGLIIALFTALMRISSSKVLRGTCICIYYSWDTNDCTTLYYLYGIPELGRLITGNADEQWTLSSVVSAIIGLSLNVGAYASEIIRGGIISIPKARQKRHTLLE